MFPSSIAPSDTLQAAFNIAQHPVTNYGYTLDTQVNAPPLMGLATPASPFQPILSAKPNDWSVSLNFVNGGGLSSTSAVGSLAIDAASNLWITDTKSRSVIEWNALGAALSPSTGFPAGGGPIAIDATGNVWISDDGALNELTNLGSPLPWSPFGGAPGGGTEAVFDAQSNLWISNSSGVNEFNSLGLQLSPVGGYVVDGISNFVSLGIDSSNNVWLATASNAQATGGQIAELSNPGGQLIASANTGAAGPQMAADNAGDLWYVAVNGSVCEALPYGGKGSTPTPNCLQVGGSNSAGPARLNIDHAAGVGLDGSDTIWVASSGDSGSAPDLPPGLLPIKPASSPTNAKPYVASSLGAALYVLPWTDLATSGCYSPTTR